MYIGIDVYHKLNINRNSFVGFVATNFDFT